jgi:hypothetical protein
VEGGESSASELEPRGASPKAVAKEGSEGARILRETDADGGAEPPWEEAGEVRTAREWPRE